MHTSIKCAALVGLTLLLAACTRSEQPLYTLTLSETGVGPLDSTTPFAIDAISTKLPGFDVTPFTAFFNGHPSTLLRISYHEIPWLIITPSPGNEKIESITLLSTHIETRPYAHIGTPVSDIYDENSLQLCDNNETYGKSLSCRSPRSKHIYYLFDEQADEPILAEILWRP